MVERLPRSQTIEQRLALTLERSKIGQKFADKHLLSVDQFERKDLDILFPIATEMKRMVAERDLRLLDTCRGQVSVHGFFEPSTRTDIGHNAAFLRVGGTVASASNGIDFSSIVKGENFPDTIRALGSYPDVIVLRTKEQGQALQAAYWLDWLKQKTGKRTVVINGGDGTGEHPTQALLDLFTIEEYKGTENKINITMVGDLRNGRTVHSLAKLAIIGNREVNFTFVSPKSLRMPLEIISLLKYQNIAFSETDNLNTLPNADVIYWTRVQKERFATLDEYQNVKNDFILTPEILSYAKADAILMHPLPSVGDMGRTEEEREEIDNDERAKYFHEMENGMYLRMAWFALVLGKY